MRALLGARLVGVWLFGSAALGDFAPARSDIDIQAVSAGRLPRPAREALAAALAHDALPCPARGLEFVLYAREDLDRPAGPEFQLNLNTGARMEHHVAFDADQDPRFWFVVDVAIGRAHGRPLHGPPPAAVFPAPDAGLVLAALREGLDWQVAHGGSPVETLLGACRSWAFASDGRWRSKAQSARWARARLDDPGPVDRALRLRAGSREPPLGAGEIRPVLDAARAALEP